MKTDILTKMALAREANNQAFFEVFRVPLKKYWNGYTGFDILAFDSQVILSGDRAPIDALREKYGDKGVKIIYALLLKDYP